MYSYNDVSRYEKKRLSKILFFLTKFRKTISLNCLIYNNITLICNFFNSITENFNVKKEIQYVRLIQDFDFQHLFVENLLREKIQKFDFLFVIFINENIQNFVIIFAQLTIDLLKIKMNGSKI